MKIFTSDGGYFEKVNFVDGNNVLVGYDMSQSCCENADWTILPVPATAPDPAPNPLPDLEPYYFDIETPPVKGSIAGDLLDSGDCISFKLVAEDLLPLWLTLFNAHNGYYSHGFTQSVGGRLALEGSL
jgi:hypothetical protein